MQQRHGRRRRSKCSSSTITLVEAGMSGTLGNQARSGYGGDNERLRSAVSLSGSLVSLQNAAQLPRGEVLRSCQAQRSARNLAKFLSQVWAWPATQNFLRILSQSSKKKRFHDKGFLELFFGTSPNHSSESIRDGLRSANCCSEVMHFDRPTSTSVLLRSTNCLYLSNGISIGQH